MSNRQDAFRKNVEADRRKRAGFFFNYPGPWEFFFSEAGRAVKLQSARDVRLFLAKITSRVFHDEMDAAKGSRLGNLCLTLIKAIETEETARRDAAERMSAEELGARVRNAIRLAMATVPAPPGQEGGTGS